MNLSTIERLKSLPHKIGVNRNDWLHVQDNLTTLAIWMADYCRAHHVPLVFTSIIRPRVEGVSISDTHMDGRAFDVSVKGYTTDDIDDILISCNRLYAQDIGAVSIRDHQFRAVIYEFSGHPEWEKELTAKEYLRSSGAIPHLHFQVRAIHS